jgi:hypothetical protein
MMMMMMTMMTKQWTGRLWRRFGTTYLAGTAVLGASQYSDCVLAVLLLQVVVLRLDAAETKNISTLLSLNLTEIYLFIQ